MSAQHSTSQPRDSWVMWWGGGEGGGGRQESYSFLKNPCQLFWASPRPEMRGLEAFQQGERGRRGARPTLKCRCRPGLGLGGRQEDGDLPAGKVLALRVSV